MTQETMDNRPESTNTINSYLYRNIEQQISLEPYRPENDPLLENDV